MLSKISLQGNANKKHNEVSPNSIENDYYPKIKKVTNASQYVENTLLV